MKPILITLINSESFILYNRELNGLFDVLESKLTVSEADLMRLSNIDKIISLLKKVLPRDLGVLTISRETIVLGRRFEDLVVENVKFSSYYIDDYKKYTIKLL